MYSCVSGAAKDVGKPNTLLLAVAAAAAAAGTHIDVSRLSHGLQEAGANSYHCELLQKPLLQVPIWAWATVAGPLPPNVHSTGTVALVEGRALLPVENPL